ncbi:MOB kinase activator-like 1A [Olea europaea var. sylvestris]|uniref:MOB kinase activator-like 1A n=1 Tax=Olea europaea var. sylvestris TaxID=158386 RepID=UPI000C1CEF99|nr:MOB kinase activator-like 1A [Olea europaea var. sylvestris]
MKVPLNEAKMWATPNTSPPSIVAAHYILLEAAYCRARLNPPLPVNYFGNCRYLKFYRLSPCLLNKLEALKTKFLEDRYKEEVSAPKYVEYLMGWIETQLDDESIFPQNLGSPFPPNFHNVVKIISKRMFRVYAHIHCSHFQKIVALKEEAYLNTCFKHFVLFTSVNHLMQECGLIDKRELAPVSEIVETILEI